MTGAARLVVAGVITAAAIALAALVGDPPADRGTDAPGDRFAAARAQPVLAHLSGTIGPRPAGSAANEAARTYLEGRLRALPRVEVMRQDATGVVPPEPDFAGVVAYNAANLLARIPGRTRDAILVSVHYDSAAGSPGAADNAVAVAAAVELARVLAESPPLERSVILLFNGAEEIGLFGARAFLSHPWAGDVRAFINLDAAGAAGRLTLFRVAGRDRRIVDAYAGAVAAPSASIVGEDLFATGLVSSDTDFSIYEKRGWPGADLALFRDGYAYHTALDIVDRVGPGALQHVGDSALALVRRLAAAPLAPEAVAPSVYYDLLGVVTVSYSAAAATVLAASALLLALGAIYALRRRQALVARAVVRAAAISVTGTFVGLVVAGVGASIAPLVLGRGLGWFARPWLAVATYAALAALGALAVDHVAGRRRLDGDARLRTYLAVDAVVAAGAAVLASLVGLGAGYVPLWSAGSLTLALVGAAVAPPRARDGLLLAGAAPGLVVTAQLAGVLFGFLPPLAGRMPLVIPVDVVLALMVALVVVPFIRLALALIATARMSRAVLAATAGLALAGLTALAVVSPFAAGRPKRVLIQDRVDRGTPTLVLRAFEANALDELTAGGKAVPVPAAVRAWWPGPALAVASPAGAAPPPPVVVRSSPWRAADGVRTVTIDVPGDGVHRLTWKIPCDVVRSWSLPEPCPRGPTPAQLLVLAPPAAGWRLELEVTSPDPIELELTRVYAGASPAAHALTARWPAWVSAGYERVYLEELRP